MDSVAARAFLEAAAAVGVVGLLATRGAFASAFGATGFAGVMDGTSEAATASPLDRTSAEFTLGVLTFAGRARREDVPARASVADLRFGVLSGLAASLVVLVGGRTMLSRADRRRLTVELASPDPYSMPFEFTWTAGDVCPFLPIPSVSTCPDFGATRLSSISVAQLEGFSAQI